MAAFYNEIDPYAAQWLRNLIKQGVIASGVVDERSIEDIEPYELRNFTQCHFFAGIGVWSHALRLAGWPDDRPVWTGSCPCQPFSAAGKGTGFADERHLWPAFHHLIRECRPPVVFGEQVASRDGLEWLDLVQADLDGTGYASAAVDLCAAGVGAPHIRQRLFWVGHSVEPGLERHARDGDRAPGWSDAAGSTATASELSGLADADHTGRQLFPCSESPRVRREAAGAGQQVQQPSADGASARSQHSRQTNGYWRDADWLYCRDGKWRPVEPGAFPLAHGATARVGRLRAYGNAIVPQAAQAFIEAYVGH